MPSQRCYVGNFRRASACSRCPYRLLAGLLAAVILLAGVGPALCRQVRGSRLGQVRRLPAVDERDYAPARTRLERAARYFADLGINGQAAAARVTLTQAYAGLGEGEKADALIEELRQSGDLSDPMLGTLYTIQGNLAKERGQYEQAEHAYQLARKLVAPSSFSEAALLQNQGALWADRGAPHRAQVLENYQQARQIYQSLNDQRGLAQILLNEGNLYENDPPRARSLFEQAWEWAKAAEGSLPDGQQRRGHRAHL